MLIFGFKMSLAIGQQGSRTRIWAKKGTRLRVVKQQQFLYEYIFGAVCLAQKKCTAVIFPFANHEGINEHLKEISMHITAGRHAVVLQDQAGSYHKKSLRIPKNISILHLPPYSPEMNPQEQVGQNIKNTSLSNKVFKNQQEITDACCAAWNSFAKNSELIHSLTTREWAKLS